MAIYGLQLGKERVKSIATSDRDGGKETQFSARYALACAISLSLHPSQYSHWCSVLHPLTDEKNEALNSSVQLVRSHIASQREELALNSGFFSFPWTELGNIWSPPHPSYLALNMSGNLNFFVCKDKNPTPPFHGRPDDLRTLAILQVQTAYTEDESPAGSSVFISESLSFRQPVHMTLGTFFSELVLF